MGFLLATALLISLIVFGCSRTESKSQNSNVALYAVVPGSLSVKEGKSATGQSQPMVKDWVSSGLVHDFTWDGNDLYVKLKNGRMIGMFSRISAEPESVDTKDDPDLRHCSITEYYRPVAVSGNLVSFESEFATLCGALNTISWSYSTVELATDGQFLYSREESRGNHKSNSVIGDLSILDLFSEADVLNAVLANDRISRDISKLVIAGKLREKPKTLAELKILLRTFEYELLDGEFFFDFASLDAFALHHADNDRVTISVSLLPRVLASQAAREYIELVLPTPAKLREQLLMASSARSGFLMNTAEEHIGSKYAQFALRGAKR